MPNPFEAYTGKTGGSGGYFSSFLPEPPKKKKKKGELTARQMAILLATMEARKKPSLSFGDILKGAGKGALGGATWALDKIMRPSWAVSAAVSEGLGGDSDTAAHNVLGAAWSGLKGETRKGFGEILDEQGVLEGHNFLRGLTGFGLDVATDPIMWASIAAAAPTLGTSVVGYGAAKAAATGASRQLLKKAAVEAGQRVVKGETDDILEEILTKAGPKYQHRLGLLKLNKALKDQSKNVMQMSSHDLHARWREIHAAERMAQAESRIYDPRKLSIVLGTTRHNLRIPTGVPVLTRPGARIAERDIPVLSQLSDKLGKAFIPGFKNDIYQAGKLSRQQAGEFNAVVQRDVIKNIFGGAKPKLSTEEMLDALHYMQQPLKLGKGAWKAVVPTGRGGYLVNSKYLDELQERGLITLEQRNFINQYHKSTNFLFTADHAVGLTYGNFEETGKMYVPHVLRPNVDIPNVHQTSLLTQAGFEHGKNPVISLKQIKEFVEGGQMDDVFELDPMMALARRSRAGAERQADMALINTLKVSIGKPTRIVDRAKVKRAEARLDKGIKQFEGATKLAAEVEELIDVRVAEAAEELTKVRDAAKLAAAKNHRTVVRAEKAAYIRTLEKAIERAKTPPKPKTRRATKAKTAAKALEGFTEREQAQIAKWQEMRKELDAMDKAGDHPAKLPASFGKKARTIKGNRRMTRREAARKRIDVWEEKLLKKRAERGDAPVEAPKPKTTTKKWKPDTEKIAKLEAELKRARKRKFENDKTKDAVRAIEQVDKDFEKAVKDLENRKSKTFQDTLGEDALTLDTASEAVRDARKEVQNAKKALKRAQQGKSNKEVNAAKWFSDTKTLDEYGNPWAFPKEARGTILRVTRFASSDDPLVDEFARGFGKWIGRWKVLMTTVNPGYRIRNSMTDYWNMWVAGVPNREILRYGAKAAKTMMDFKKFRDDPVKGMKAFRIIQEASDHGIMSGLFAGDIQRVAQMFKHAQSSYKDLAQDGRFIQLYTKAAQDFNRNAENLGRLTHYMYRREALKESAADAAFRVKIAHFDYEDLTPFEQKYMKRVFPFYTWTRKNVPYQLRQIAAQPGRYSAFPKLAQEAEYATVGSEPGSAVPDYISDQMGFRIPFGGPGTMYLPQFGVSDISVFQSPEEAVQRGRSLLGPQFKIPAEILTGKSLFTGLDIAPERHPRVPFSGRGAGLLGLIPGTDVGQTSRLGPGEEPIESPGMNPWAAYAVSQIPMGRAIFGIGANTDERRRNQLLSYVGGQSIQTVNPEMQAYYERLRIEEQVDKLISGFRDEGVYPRSDRKKTDFEKLIEKILRGNY